MKQAFENLKQWCNKQVQVQCMVEIIDADSVGDVICQKITELKPDAVIMGTHNKGVLKEFFVGSVTKLVMSSSSKTPVIIIHNQ
jgi:nucleotide-binding universal stress UspA family protein